ncbi:MAG: glycosyltransferase family 9 protein [Psychroflexus maritimus]
MKQKIEHILVIRLSAMGDVAMLIPVLEIVHATYPRLKISVLTKPFFSHLFAHLDFVNIHVAEVKGKHKGVAGLFKLSSELPDDIDAVADVHNVLRSKILRKFFALKGMKIKKINKGRKEKKELTKLKTKKIHPLKSSHQRYADVFEKLGFPINLKRKLEAKKLEIGNSIKTGLGIEAEKKYIGFAPFAAHHPKAYPKEKSKKLIELIIEQTNIQLLLFGGGKDEVNALHQLKGKHNQVQVVAGKFDFKAELALISNLKLMISMDSGNGHLAAMFQVPVITIWGATHPFAGFAPFGQLKENQFLPDLNQYPLLPTSIYGKKEVKGYENLMHSIDEQAIVNRIKTIILEK